jgi:hypothetical protein
MDVAGEEDDILDPKLDDFVENGPPRIGKSRPRIAAVAAIGVGGTERPVPSRGGVEPFARIVGTEDAGGNDDGAVSEKPLLVGQPGEKLVELASVRQIYGWHAEQMIVGQAHFSSL